MDNEIILYQPDNSISLEVRVEDETVWLTQQQIADLFGRDRTVIGRHIRNIFNEGELEESLVCAKFAHTKDYGRREGFSQTKEITFYNLDVIISVGYRVKSIRGTQFRIWANQILKEYLLRGYAFNNRLLDLENRLDYKINNHQKKLDELSEKVDLIINSNLRPTEGIFFEGQIWDAYLLINDLIRSAESRIVVIDNYADDSVLKQLDKRKEGIEATVLTHIHNKTIKQDLERHNSQYPPISLKFYQKVHDRFLIIDNTIYHIGASFKDLGKKLFAFTRMQTPTGDELLSLL